MKREISKKIKSISDGIGTSAAAAESERIIDRLEREYDAKLDSGMSELDAYRSVLKNVDAIEAMLTSLPKTDNEVSREERKKTAREFKKALSTTSTVMWILAVIAFFVLQSAGEFKSPWLIFIYAAILENIISMVKKYNSGKSLKKTLRGGLSAIIWLLSVIVFFAINGVIGSAWLVFLVGAIAQVIINDVTKK